MKFAYFVLPHVGGTYSVFKHLRAGLASYGIDVQWLAACSESYELPAAMRDESAFGALLPMPSHYSESARAKNIVMTVRDGGFDGVFVNVLSDRLETNIARYLPQEILRIMVVHTITPATYAAARSIRDHVHATIAVSERCCQDLTMRYGFSNSRTATVSNAVDIPAFRKQRLSRDHGGPALRVLFVGRIDDTSKGVLWLGEILDASPDAVTLTVVGDGPDMPRLRQRLARHADHVRYTGAVLLDTIPSIMADHDVLIMPSRFEGFGLTLVEAMAGGCVPVVSHIRGVTDTIVENGKNGLLFPVGDCRAAARAITRLDQDRDLLHRMSASASGIASARYSVEKMAAGYHQVISSASINKRPLAPVLNIDDWSIPLGMRPGLRTYIPRPIKNWLRMVGERR